MGNPSTNFCNFPESIEDYYILGLWCADGYHRTSSIGLTNTDRELIARFKKFLLRNFPEERLRLDVYTKGKRKQNGYKLYVNCRSLLRIFKAFKDSSERNLSDTGKIRAYFAGRFDGDGCISKDLRKDCRISYGNIVDAKLDYDLLVKMGLKNSKLYRYRTSNTYVNYISRFDSKKFVNGIIKYSNKLQKLVLGSPRDFPQNGGL